MLIALLKGLLLVGVLEIDILGVNDQESGCRRFWCVLRQGFLLKCLGTPAFTAIFFIAYVHLLKHPYAAVTVMPTFAIDKWVPFHPWALLPYCSLWLYVSIPPTFMTRYREIVAYGWRTAALCTTGLACFLFWPTAVPPANIDWALYPGMDFLKGVDAAGNACPSLHVATAVYSAIWLHELLRAFGAKRVSLIINWAWCLLIVYSTLATKQHVAVDVFAGAALGLVFAWLSLLKREVFDSLKLRV
jgi:membrane-associated phospholipid phosphatase